MQEIELLGLKCPMPVLKVKKALAKMEPGEVLLARTDDPHALADIELFAKQSGHEVRSQTTGEDGVTVHEIVRR